MTTLDLNAMGWSRRRNRCPRLPLSVLPAADATAEPFGRAGENPFSELPLPGLPAPSPTRGPAGEEPSFRDHPPARLDVSDPVGLAEDTVARSDPNNATEPRAPSGSIISGRGALLPGLGPGESLSAVLECRLEQIQRWGHTPEKDRAQPIVEFLDHMLPHEINYQAIAAVDDHRARNGLAQIRKRLVKLAAICLAAIDRIDAELAAAPLQRED